MNLAKLGGIKMNIIEVGQTYGRLTVVSLSHKCSRKRANFWNCKCSCGKEIKIIAASLNRSRSPSKSCGCLRIESVKGKPAKNRKNEGIAGANAIYLAYKKSASTRFIDFNLSFDEFYDLTGQNCSYCNSEPYGKRSQIGTHGDFIYNGIDRVDNTIGYELDNCVPCCKKCNYAKHKMSVGEFINLIENIYQNRNNLPIKVKQVLNWEQIMKDKT